MGEIDSTNNLEQWR